jgi:hypothetical protein
MAAKALGAGMVGRDLGEDVQEAGIEHAVHMYPARVHAVEQRGGGLASEEHAPGRLVVGRAEDVVPGQGDEGLGTLAQG